MAKKWQKIDFFFGYHELFLSNYVLSKKQKQFTSIYNNDYHNT